MNTHPLHGVHGRPNRYSDRAGTVVHVTEGTSEAPAFLYLLLDEPRTDGTMILIIRSTDFVPTDPAALRASLAPRNYAAEVDRLTAENGRLREALANLRDAAQPAYAAGRVDALAFVAAGNVLAEVTRGQ